MQDIAPISYHSHSQEDVNQNEDHLEEKEEYPLTREEESSVKEVSFVLDGKLQHFVIAKEVEAAVDQFPEEEDFEFSL
jgi:hypothetical protein